MKKSLIAIALCAPAVSGAYFEIKQTSPQPVEAPREQHGANAAPSALPGVGQAAPRDEQLQVIATRRLSPIRHSGAKGQAATVEGFGEGIPLDVAIEMVIPPGWAGLAAQGVEPERHKVSWSPDKSWVDTLEDFAFNTNHEIEVDWARKEVIVRPQKGMTAMERNQLRVAEASFSGPQDEALTPMGSIAGASLQAGVPTEGAMTLETFLREPVRVDLRAATAEQVLLAALPPGFRVETVDVNPSKLNRLLDVTTPIGETRSSFLHLLGQELGVRLTPFPHLGRLLMTDAPQ